MNPWDKVGQARNTYDKACNAEQIATEVQACNPCEQNNQRLRAARHDKSNAYRAYLHAFNDARKSGVPHPDDKS